MKVKKIISAIIYPACLFFTLLTLISQTIVTLAGFTTLILTFKTLIAFFVFSLLLSALNRIFYIKSFGIGLKIFLHYIGFLISFLVIFLVIISGNYKSYSEYNILYNCWYYLNYPPLVKENRKRKQKI